MAVTAQSTQEAMRLFHSYRPLPGVPSYFALPIDFVFVRAPQLPGFHIESQLAFSDKVELMDRRLGYLSDHLAIHTKLHWDRPLMEPGIQTPHPVAHPVTHHVPHRAPPLTTDDVRN